MTSFSSAYADRLRAYVALKRRWGFSSSGRSHIFVPSMSTCSDRSAAPRCPRRR